jgi:type I phosphodiesterase/nucleotide pyrophosphatase
MRGSARSPATDPRSRRLPPKPVVLIVIDGLTPSMLEATETPALRFLLEHGSYRRAASAFPSLTPVCLASIATGGHPDVHGIPHLVWWHRGEQRLVEYGSSFAALRASGLAQGIRDTIVNLNEEHLLPTAETVFEAVEDAGMTPAAVNITTYRGRTLHRPLVPGLPPVKGPKRFFFYSLYESDRTGARFAWWSRSLGSVDAYAASIGRWLVTRDGFDLLVLYLPDYDYASHALGPGEAHEALARADEAVAAVMDATGGPDAFLERYAVVLCSDHGQSPVRHVSRLVVDGVRVAASNRAAMLYGEDARTIAAALDDDPAVDVALFLDDGRLVARRQGDEDVAMLDEYPDGRARAEGALRNPNAGDVLVSAADGWEFVDLAGRHHARGGSHGSLQPADSEVPMLTIGLSDPPASITQLKGLVLEHLGVAVARAA